MSATATRHAPPAVRDGLISLAGLVGSRVRNPAGDPLGRLADVVIRFDGDAARGYPPASGLILRLGHRQVWLGAKQIAGADRAGMRLRGSRVDLREYRPRSGEVRLAAELLDRQLIDVDGRRVIRAADLFLASRGGELRLVGVDVSFAGLIRRLGPAALRARPTSARVIDWAAIEPLRDAAPAGGVRMRTSADALHDQRAVRRQGVPR
jgi:hypothetical protein